MPLKYSIPKTKHSVLACGSDIKNCFSFFQNSEFYYSAHHADLIDHDNYLEFLKHVRLMARKNKFKPDIIAYDMHPAYLSSKAKEIFPQARAVAVQHHYAHIASVLAVSAVKNGVIGVAFDGTGYGLDGRLWGGEFIIANKDGFSRNGHLQYLQMPTADTAVRQPWRMALSLLYNHMAKDIAKIDLACMRQVPESQNRILINLLRSNSPMPLTSSCGRLFDAISSLLGIVHAIDHEAQAAIELEKAAALSKDKKSYPLDIQDQQGTLVVGYGPLVRAILADLQRNLDKQVIARRFHNSLVQAIIAVVKRLSSRTGFKDVVLSGGVFQNRILKGLAIAALRKAGFCVLDPAGVCVNDLSLCIGQTYIALEAYRALA